MTILDYEELRPIVLDTLKEQPETQIINILNRTEGLAINKGYYKDVKEWQYMGQVTKHKMPSEDREKIREIINDLVVEGILGWGINEHNPGPPFLKVTRYGQVCLSHAEPQPYDPDGYLKYLKSEIPNVDGTVIMYITESLNAYLRGLTLSSTVMLGGASEKAFLLLLESFTNAISDPTKKAQFENNTKGQIKKKSDEFRKTIIQIRKTLPKPLSDDLDTQLDGIFNFIRTCRNDVGHPTGRKIERSLAYANLRLFVPYCKRIYELIEHFKNNTIIIT